MWRARPTRLDQARRQGRSRRECEGSHVTPFRGCSRLSRRCGESLVCCDEGAALPASIDCRVGARRRKHVGGTELGVGIVGADGVEPEHLFVASDPHARSVSTAAPFELQSPHGGNMGPAEEGSGRAVDLLDIRSNAVLHASGGCFATRRSVLQASSAPEVPDVLFRRESLRRVSKCGALFATAVDTAGHRLILRQVCHCNLSQHVNRNTQISGPRGHRQHSLAGF